MNLLGILAGLATAGLWSLTAICFEASGRRIGSLAVNVLRLLVAAILFAGLSLLRSGHLWPAGLASSTWIDLSLSGLVGFVVGDLMLFQALVLLGARLSMLIYSSVPAMTALAGYLFLGERIGGRSLMGMAITVAGIALAIVGKHQTNAETQPMRSRRFGIALAIGGSAGQSAGLLLAKHGSSGLDSFAATQIRVLAGLAGFLAIALATQHLRAIATWLKLAFLSPTEPSAAAKAKVARSALAILSIGALLGPFLGVSLGLLSAQRLPTGVASTLMSLVPVLLIPISAIALRERTSPIELTGTAVAFAGVVVMAV